MVKTIYINSFHIKIILILSTFTLSLQQFQCVLGANCPFNQGMCRGDFCKCLDGFYSLLDPNLLADQQIYCNYEQINVYIPLILEMFLPSIGHFYAGKYWLGTLKLLLLIMHVSTSLILFGYIGVPKFVIFIIEKFGISLKSFFPEGLLGESKEEGKKKEEDDNKTNLDTEGKDDEKKDDLQKEVSLTTSIVSIKYLLRGNQKQDKNDNNINRGNITQIKQAHNEKGNDIYNPEIEEPFIEKEENNEKEEENENEDNKECKEKNTILEVIFKISTLFWVFWILDLFFFKFKIYNDGNDVPFVE